MLWKSEPYGHLKRRKKAFHAVPLVNEVCFPEGSLIPYRSEIKDLLRSPWDLKNSVHRDKKKKNRKSKSSLIIILCFCCQHAYSVPELPQHNLRWKFSDQNFSYKSQKLGFKPVMWARLLLSPGTWQVRCLWVTHLDGLDLDIGMCWKGKKCFPACVWPFKIGLLTILSCACKHYCFLPVPSFLWVSPNWHSSQPCELVLSPQYRPPIPAPCFWTYNFPFPGTYMSRLDSAFFPEKFFLSSGFFLNHNNSAGIYRYYPHFMDVDTKVQVQIACTLSFQLERNCWKTVLTPSLPWFILQRTVSCLAHRHFLSGFELDLSWRGDW